MAAFCISCVACKSTQRELPMEIIGTCLNCFPSSGCLLANSVGTLAVLGVAIWRGSFSSSVR